MEKKVVLVMSVILLIISANMVAVNSDASDCNNACTTACVNPDCENGSRKISLCSSDGEVFEVDESVALESQTIKHLIEDDCADNVIPLSNVTGKILSKVIEYCKRHVDAAVSDEELKPSMSISSKSIKPRS